MSKRPQLDVLLINAVINDARLMLLQVMHAGNLAAITHAFLQEE